MWTFSFPASLRPDTGGEIAVRFRDLPEAITSGGSRADAITQAFDCLDEAIAGRICDGLDIPVPSKPNRGELLVALPATMAAKAAFYIAFRESGLTKTQMAKRLGIDEKEVRRMLDPRHPTRLLRIQMALASLGKQLLMGMVETAA